MIPRGLDMAVFCILSLIMSIFNRVVKRQRRIYTPDEVGDVLNHLRSPVLEHGAIWSPILNSRPCPSPENLTPFFRMNIS
jgi:hypothetical protein